MKILDKLFGRKSKTNSPGKEEVQDLQPDSNTELIGQAFPPAHNDDVSYTDSATFRGHGGTMPSGAFNIPVVHC